VLLLPPVPERWVKVSRVNIWRPSFVLRTASTMAPKKVTTRTTSSLYEDQLKLHSLRIKDNHLQKQREVLVAKRQRTNMQVKSGS
jgi:hypothetical protein